MAQDLLDLRSLLAPTARLRLRWLEERDEADFCALYTCPRTMREIGEPLAPDEARRRFVARLRMQQQTLETPILITPDAAPANGKPLDWPWDAPGIERPSLGVRVVAEPLDESGFAVLLAVDCWGEDVSQWELGVMAPRGRQGRGFPVESMSALTERLLESGVTRVVLRCSARNLAARRVARQAGFAGQEASRPEGPQIYWNRTAAV